MRRFAIVLSLAVSLLLLVAAGRNETTRDTAEAQPLAVQAKAAAYTQVLRQYHTMKALTEGVYVGSEFCISCHQSDHTWRETKHAQALRRPMTQYSLMPGKGVVADYDGNDVDDFQQGLDFNQISSAFDPFKPHAPVLSYAEGAYWITIGESTMPVVATQGGTGDWKQRYLVRVPVADTDDGYSAENYISPIQYNEATDEYVLYHADAWYDDSNQPRYAPATAVSDLAAQNDRSYSKKCIGCHTTGTRDLGQNADGEWIYRAYPAVLYAEDDPGYFDYDHDGIFDLVNIGCEACHGPGSAHITSGGNPEYIVNPDKLATPAANEVCGQCHARVKSVPNGIHDWPLMDDTGEGFVPGGDKPLATFFTDASGRWPDGINSRKHHQQYLDFLESPKPGFQFHPVKCIECHDSHGQTTNEHLIRDVYVDGDVEIPTRVRDNSLCLSCHATHGDFEEISVEMVANIGDHQPEIGEIVAAHSRHPYGPTRRMGLSRCTDCHNPKIATSAVPYDITSHTFEAIPPEKTLVYQEEGGMPNACAVSCHGQKVNTFRLGYDEEINTWDSEFDRNLAGRLMRLYGPNGFWWMHTLDEEGEGEGEGDN